MTLLNVEHLECRAFTDVIHILFIGQAIETNTAVVGDTMLLHNLVDALKNKYRLICNVNSDLLVKTVELARGEGLQAVGLAMHILADTWAHRYFAGTPSLVINNINYSFYERVPEGDGTVDRHVTFRHNPKAKDDPEKSLYTNTIYRSSENSVMNLGHGRAGHLPDYGFAVYRYLPAWADYEEVVKNNPEDFHHAFCQMVYGKGMNADEATAFIRELDRNARLYAFEGSKR